MINKIKSQDLPLETRYSTGTPLERVPGNPSTLEKAQQNTKILRKPSLNFDDS